MMTCYHPQLNDQGMKVLLHHPSVEGEPEAWLNASHVARAIPGGWLPQAINGVPFASWKQAPTTAAGWKTVPGQDQSLIEPPFHTRSGMKSAAGVVIEEADGRIWVVHPSNTFGGYQATFPKGTLEEDLPMQAVAIKETFEESGLQVEITGYLLDMDRSRSRTRYYRARRVGGTPADCGWESQAVSLVPANRLYSLLNRSVDHPLAKLVGAG